MILVFIHNFHKPKSNMKNALSSMLLAIFININPVYTFKLGVTDIALGYNVTTSNLAPGGKLTVILDGLQLINSAVTGYHVTIGEDDCSIRLEIWDKLNDEEYRLNRYRDFYGNKGYYEISLPPSEEFNVREDQRLGFTSLKETSTCVGYLYVTDDRRSQTRRFFFQNSSPPEVNRVYKFAPYQTTFLFPIGVIVKDPAVRTTTTTTTTTTPQPTTTTRPTTITTVPEIRIGRFIGYNYTDNQMSRPGKRTVIHHGLQLENGKVIGYRFRNSKIGCRPRLQIWRLVSETLGLYNYTLIFEKIYDGSKNGLVYWPLQPSAYFDINRNDKLGFTSEDEDESCIPFHYVQTDLRSQTINRYYPNGNYPRLYDTLSFEPYQTTYLFALEVELLVRASQGATGPQGLKGIRGNSGEQGQRGELGSKGVGGDAGPKGETGDTGLKGNIGFKGFRGETGPVGSRGPNGEDGNFGSRGEKGVLGSKGPRGDQGFSGERGDIGPEGPVGNTGATGTVGDRLRGEPGATGVMGPIGSTGPVAFAGDRGDRGTDGVSGPVGQRGVTGARGPMWHPDNVDHCSSSSLNCEHNCVNTRLGARCGCYPGYDLKDNRCIEINECHIENGICEYNCINTPGSYMCGCPLGLRLSKNGKHCNDVDECESETVPCKTGQICINLWNDHYCAGPFDKSSDSPTTSSQIGDDLRLVTRDIVIGLLIWLIILSILTVMAVILIAPECRECCGGNKPRYPQPGGRRPQFYYPAFFPRVSLDRRPSSDRMDIIEGRQSRNENEQDGIVNEAHLHEGQQRSEL